MSFSDVMFERAEKRRESIDERRRQRAIEETQCAAKYGSPRLPLAVVMDETLSDTFIGKLIDLHAEGLAEREKEQTK